MKIDDGHGSEFAEALGAAIRARGVSLTWLYRQLSARANPVSMATLSYWRSGARQPEGAASMAAVDEAEALLSLAPGELSRLIRPAARIGAIPAARVPDDDDVAQAIDEISALLGTTPPSGLRDLSTMLIADVGGDGNLRSVTLRALVQSTASVMTSVPLFDLITDPSPSPLTTLTNVVGGHFAPTYRHGDGQIICDVLELDRPVPPGGTTMFEYTEVYHPGHPNARAITHTVSRPARQTIIWVRFDPAGLPDWCEEFVESDDDETVRALDASDAAVHAYRFGFGPATLGVRWGFDDEVTASDDALDS